MSNTENIILQDVTRTLLPTSQCHLAKGDDGMALKTKLADLAEEVKGEVVTWFDEYRPAEGRLPKTFVMCAGLAITERMREAYPLEQHDYITEGSQVRTSGTFIQGILKRHGVTKTLSREGGRTTRSTRTAAERLVERLNDCSCSNELEELSDDDRSQVLDHVQEWLVARVKDFFNQKRIEVDINLTESTRQIVANILREAEKRKKAGPVAQHLVGAKLALRFPGVDVENHSYTTADVQLGRPGDFLLGDTVIHVTVAPALAVFEKCKDNLRKNYRVVLIVPEDTRQAAFQLAKLSDLGSKVSIYALEDFIGQNVSEMSGFTQGDLAHGMWELLTKYNERVSAVETDLSLMIEIPENLEP